MLSGIGRTIVTLLLAATLCYAALIAFLYFQQRSILFPGASLGSGVPPAHAAWGRSVLIGTRDGETLHALYSAPRAGDPTVLFFHGNADSIDNYRFLADAFSARGLGLLAPSYRGYGGSSGRPSEAGLYADGLAARDWLAENGHDVVVLLGQSLGTAVAVGVAAERPAGGMVLISAFDSTIALARSLYPFLPIAPLLRDPFRSDLTIGRAAQPKLFIHGDRDEVVPIRFGQALYDLAPEPKTFVVKAGLGHNDLWSPELVEDVIGFVEAAARR